VVLEGRTRTAQISLINRGAKQATYRIAFIQMRMTEEGQLEEIEAAESGKLADGFVRYSPRQVTLEPELAQTVRLLVRKPADLPAGEYRSHLLLYAIPSAGQADVETMELKDKEIEIRLTPIYRVSIPVIVREGELAASVALTDLTYAAGNGADVPPSLSFSLRRGGERSIYGDVTVTFVATGGRPERVVGEIKGLAVYTSTEVRRVQMPLYPPAGVELEGGVLEVSFAEPRETKAGLRAEATVPLP